MSAPTFILFAPQLGENIGAVARAMSNFGLNDLRIVAPRDGWPNPAAEAMAAHGLPVIQGAQIFETLADACHDITHLYATTARERALDKPVFTPGELYKHIFAGDKNIPSPSGRGIKGEGKYTTDTGPHPGPLPEGEGVKWAILFGPERSGLSNEEIVVADGVITIPVSDQNPSLNLAQASVVMAYEWFVQQNTPLQAEEVAERATKAEINGLLNHLKPLLDEVNYFREPSRADSMWLTIKNIFFSKPFTQQEVQTLRGVVRAIQRARD